MTLENIGEGDSSLLCVTNRDGCCSSQEGGAAGEWHFPNNGSTVGTNNGGGSFYRNRGPSVVRLNRRHNAMSPTGVFRCEIPDTSNNNQTVYVGVYAAEKGKPAINQPLEYAYSNDSELGQQMLTCTSVGGPATSVSWWKDGQQSSHDHYQRITDSINSVYDNVLLLDQASPGDVVGNYTCRVSNERGEDSKTMKLHGESNNLLNVLCHVLVALPSSHAHRPTNVHCH